MRKATTVYLLSAVAMACLALATTTINCGGTSGDRPGGTGGSSGGTGGGSGGGAGGSTSTSTATAFSCASPIVPANGGTDGFVTDFSDYTTSGGKWGSTTNLYGSVYAYAEPSISTMSYKVDATAKTLRGTGNVLPSSYAGIGMTFYVCATVASFSQLQFTVSGSSPGCDMELQIKTFDQSPVETAPGGGCYRDAGGSCYGFPVVKQVAVPSATATDVVVSLSSFSNWSNANAVQVVGMQWQFTGTNVDPDAGAGCPIDVSVSNIKFLP